MCVAVVALIMNHWKEESIRNKTEIARFHFKMASHAIAHSPSDEYFNRFEPPKNVDEVLTSEIEYLQPSDETLNIILILI